MRRRGAEKLVYEYDKRDEEGNVIGRSRAIDEVDIDVKEGQYPLLLAARQLVRGMVAEGEHPYRSQALLYPLPYLIRRDA